MKIDEQQKYISDSNSVPGKGVNTVQRVVTTSPFTCGCGVRFMICIIQTTSNEIFSEKWF